MMIFVNLILSVLFGFSSPGWAQSAWGHLKQTVVQADLEPNRKKQKELANQAIQEGENCLKNNPQAWGCLYYKTQAEGIAHQSFFGYTSRVRQMIQDWEKVLAVDPAFDNGGPYRMIAEVYIDLPKHFGPKDLQQDLKKSIDYLNKALAISDYPTNALDLAEAYKKSGDSAAVEKALERVKTALPKWRQDPYFADWKMRLQFLSPSD